jgi:hypothetical protein
LEQPNNSDLSASLFLIRRISFSTPEAERCRLGEGEAHGRSERRALGEDLQREYLASVEKLAPLLALIGEVDRLIDSIVYRLYGLTAEEVAIVEGSLP